MIAALRGLPQQLQRAGHRAGCTHRDRILAGRTLHCPDHLTVGRQCRLINGPRAIGVDRAQPVLAGIGIGGLGLIIAKRRAQHLQRDLGIGHEAFRPVLGRVIAVDIDRDELRPCPEQRPRAGGEVLEPRAHPDHQIGVLRGGIGRRRSVDARGPETHRMALREARLARLRLGHRDLMRRRELGQSVLGLAIDHTAACDDHRALGPLHHLSHTRQFPRSGSGTANAPHAGLEELHRVIVSLGLRVLTEGQHGGAAIGRIGHHPQRAGQRGQDMLRPRDTVVIARDRPEAVIGADGAVVKILDLLEHRIGTARGKHVARHDQHRQPVHMRQRGGRHEVRRARPDA